MNNTDLKATEAFTRLTGIHWVLDDDAISCRRAGVGEEQWARFKRLERLADVRYTSARNQQEVHITTYDAQKLEKLDQQEPQRHEAAPRLASLLSAFTLYGWKWDGNEIVTVKPLNDTEFGALQDKLKAADVTTDLIRYTLDPHKKKHAVILSADSNTLSDALKTQANTSELWQTKLKFKQDPALVYEVEIDKELHRDYLRPQRR